MRLLLLVLFAMNVAAEGGPSVTEEQVRVIETVLEQTVSTEGSIAVTNESSSPVAGLTQFENRHGELKLESRTDAERDLIVPRDLWVSFQRNNPNRQRIVVLPAVSDVLIISPDRLKLHLPDSSHESWERFHAEWPHIGAVVRLTKPAISNDGRKALIYVTVSRGPLDGEAAVVLLERSGDAWMVKARYIVVVS